MLCLLLFGALGLSACQPVQRLPSTAAVAAPPAFTIEVTDDAVIVPEVVPGGIVHMTIKNSSSIPMDIGMARVLEGSSPAEVIALAQGDFESNFIPIMNAASFLASFNPVAPGAEAWAYVDLRTGDFVVDATEHVEGAPVTGAPHLNGSFTANEIVGTVAPEADVVVDMVNFAYIMPDEIKAGPQLWEFTNSGEQWHMLFVVDPAEGAGIEEVLAALESNEPPAGPPPFEFVPDAGIAPIGAGERVWLEFALPPGEYLVGCPVPDVAAIMAGGPPLSHLAHGMHRMINVVE